MAKFKVLWPNIPAKTQKSHGTTQTEELDATYIRKEQIPKACKTHCRLNQLAQ
jgi:hypothetical protein